ncbi:hypothetical protein BaRGS_00020568, partial [Batillaria attramentaria]
SEPSSLSDMQNELWIAIVKGNMTRGKKSDLRRHACPLCLDSLEDEQSYRRNHNLRLRCIMGVLGHVISVLPHWRHRLLGERRLYQGLSPLAYQRRLPHGGADKPNQASRQIFTAKLLISTSGKHKRDPMAFVAHQTSPTLPTTPKNPPAVAACLSEAAASPTRPLGCFGDSLVTRAPPLSKHRPARAFPSCLAHEGRQRRGW